MDGTRDSRYGLSVIRSHWFFTTLLGALLGVGAGGNDFASALERARKAGISHRYAEVIEILTPFNAVEDSETRYITAAEIGRAFYHLGRYREAHRAFREAVRLHPERAETAIYLEATSYLVGDTVQAYTILREILKSGARDLYLAVTLPGERRFAADPEVQAIIQEFAVPLDVDIEQARILGVGLGEHRDVAVHTLEAQSFDEEASALTASAGPALIWAFIFDGEQQLDEILIQTENLLRYTPYRLRFDDTLGWRTTPAAAIAALGPPDRTAASLDDGIAVTWERPSFLLTLDFGRPRPPRPHGIPEGAAMLRTIQFKRQTLDSTDRMIE
jgi:tetratricopeptide (TPR) repeat protein